MIPLGPLKNTNAGLQSNTVDYFSLVTHILHYGITKLLKAMLSRKEVGYDA